MLDVEYITSENHRRARERELGERWDTIVRNRRRQSKALKTAETVCFTVACIAAGAAAVFFGFGCVKPALITTGVVAIFGLGALAFCEP